MPILDPHSPADLSPLYHAAHKTAINWRLMPTDSLQLPKSDKPCFVFLGYYECHWTREMLNNVFQDSNVIEMLNQSFHCYIVDREFRTDVDIWLQRAAQQLTQDINGWPLCAFIDSQISQPFFIGNYYEQHGDQQTPGFLELLATISTLWQTNRAQIQETAQAIKLNPNETLTVAKGDESITVIVEHFISQVLAAFDEQWGGLKGPTKFPNSALLETILAIIILYRPPASEQLYRLLMLTSQSIKNIGLNDHVEGGYFRYCRDGHWGIPHFEKTLNDNAALLNYFTSLSAFNKDGDYLHECLRIYHFVQDNLALEGHGYASLQSEQFNGLDHYQSTPSGYTFDKEAIEQRLPKEQIQLAKLAFGLEQAPNNFSQWHLQRWYSTQTLAEKLGVPLKQVQWQIEPIREQLKLLRQENLQASKSTTMMLHANCDYLRGLINLSYLVNDENLLLQIDSAIEALSRYWDPQHGLNYPNPLRGTTLLDYVALSLLLWQAIKRQWNNEQFNWLQQVLYFIEQNFYTGHQLQLVTNTSIALKESNIDQQQSSVVGPIIFLFQRLGVLCQNQSWLDLSAQLQVDALIAVNKAPLKCATTLHYLARCAAEPFIVVRGQHSTCLPWLNQAQDSRLKIDLIYLPDNIADSLGIFPPSNSGVAAYLWSAQKWVLTTEQTEFKQWFGAD
ncbi:MAG: thioredoxin domain-containing protein [Gammaproteobacteria bacterium]|nr:thioredoxin domain-containing protein [Gammaproteobacteria bacterium]